MSKLAALLQSDQFGAGLAAGVAGAGVLLVVISTHAWWRRRSESPRTARRGSRARYGPPPGAIGIAFALATLAAIAWLVPGHGLRVRGSVVAAIGLLWLAGALAGRLEDHRGPAGALLAVPGGLMLAGGTPGVPGWAGVLLVVGPAVAGTLTADVDDRHGGTGTSTLAFALALVGMYFTVPDTELSRSALGAAAPLVLLAWPFTLARFGRGGSYAATGVFLWIAVIDGAGRPGSIVGAAACLGVLLAEPVGRMLAGRDGAAIGVGAPPAVLIGMQVVVVFLCSRVAGFRTSGSSAALLAGVVLAAAVAVTASLARTRTAPRRP